jgi:Protein of unknown function (DUF2953)
MILLFLIVFLLGIAFVLLSLMLLLYLIPVDVTALVEKEAENISASVTLIWGILMIQARYHGSIPVIRFLIRGHPILTRPVTGMAGPHAAGRLKEPGGDIGEAIRLILQVWPGIRRALSAFFRSLSLTRLTCSVRFGTQDAATTGLVFGCCAAILPLQFLSSRISVEVTPVFDRELLEGCLSTSFRINHVLLICIPLTRLLLDRKTRGALYRVRQERLHG